MNGVPTFDRLKAACLIAAAVAASPSIISGPLVVFYFPAAFGIAGIHVMLLGLPAYLVLRRRHNLTLAPSAAGGFAVGAIPSAVLAIFKADEIGSYPWLWPLLAGCFGLFGGVAFWVVIQAPGPNGRQPSDESADSSSSTSSALL